MKGLMQDFPLTLDLILRRCLEPGRLVEVVSVTPAGLDRRTWGDIGERSLAVRGVLEELDVAPGASVATFAWNSHRHVELFLGIPCAGRVVHAVNVRLTGDQIADLVHHVGDEVAFVDASLTPLIAPLRDQLGVREFVVLDDGAEIDGAFAGSPRYEELLSRHDADSDLPALAEDDAAWICHTSGTTGRPKAVVSTHRSAVLHSMSSLMVDNHAISRSDTVLPVTPMFHANAWGMPYTSALAGAKLVLAGRDASPEALASLIETERVTVGAAVPTVWIRLMEAFDSGRDLSSLRTILCGGATVPASLVTSITGHGIQLMVGWGMTETSPTGTGLKLTAAGSNVGDGSRPSEMCVGKAVPGIEARVVDADGEALPWDGTSIGELELRGPWVIRAYFKPDDDANEARFHDGWLRTGDLGRIAPDGTVELVDRLKDLIKSGGEWISSLELEQALSTHPDVNEITVVAVPDARWGERPAAVIVPVAGRAPAQSDLASHLNGKVAKWWIPDVVRIVDEIPRTAVGKYDKRRLREQLAAELAGSSPPG
jgi:fatty-acyl-CoA synthase